MHSECTNVRPDVLDMLDICTGCLEDMGYAEQQACCHQLQYCKQAEEQLKRELQWYNLAYCFNTNLNGSNYMMCCLVGDNQYNHCGSPNHNQRLQEGDSNSEMAPASTIIAECTDDLKVQAISETEACFGSAENVFCESVQISIG